MFVLDKNCKLQTFLKVKHLSSLTTLFFFKAFQVLSSILFRLRAFYSQVQRSNMQTKMFSYKGFCTADMWGDRISLNVWCSCVGEGEDETSCMGCLGRKHRSSLLSSRVSRTSLTQWRETANASHEPFLIPGLRRVCVAV